MTGLVTACVCVVGLVTLTHGERLIYDGHEVWRVTPTTLRQLEFLVHLQDRAHAFQLDFWKEPSAVQRLVVLRVPPKRRNEMYLRFGLQGLVPEVTINDLQSAINKEDALYTQKSFSELADFDYGKYHSLDDVNSWMQQIAARYPDRVHLFNISRSYEGRVIKAMKVNSWMQQIAARYPDRVHLFNISRSYEGRVIKAMKAVGKNDSSTRPGFFFNGGIHAREWISPATVIYMAAQLIEQYGKSPNITEMVDAIDWYILPVFNVDGYEYTWTTDRNWRKTRSRNFGCRGVDPNRNWDWEWCVTGANKDPCSDNYCGPRAFSEVEVKGVADFLNSVPGRFRAYIDFHSFSQLWMTPWGYTTQLPPDFPIQNKCSMTATDALTAVHGTKYRYGSIGHTYLSFVSGDSVDWVYGAAKVRYATGVELRDTGKYGFLLPADQIIPSGEETLQGVLAMAKFILDNP